MVGAAVLVALGVIFIPLLLDGSGRVKWAPAIPDIPVQPNLPEPLPIDETPIVLLGGTKSITDEKEPTGQVTSAANTENLSAWVVQVGSFNKKNNALQLMKELQAGGFKAFVEPVNIATGVSHRVRIGPEMTRVKATRTRDQIAREYSREGVVMPYLGPDSN
jgi:DedD protein